MRHSVTEFHRNHMCIWVRGHCVPTVSLTVLSCVENILFSENPAWKKDNYSVSVHVCYQLLRPCYHCERCTAIVYVGFVVRAWIKPYLANEFLGHRTWSLNRHLSIFWRVSWQILVPHNPDEPPKSSKRLIHSADKLPEADNLIWKSAILIRPWVSCSMQQEHSNALYDL